MHFNSRPHGGRQHFVLTPVSPLIFQLTPSRRATLKERLVLVRQYYFNSRPHGGRHQSLLSEAFLTHFNSRPHGGRLPNTAVLLALSVISTHALTEGDIPAPFGHCAPGIFQLTPSRRATRTVQSSDDQPAHFNSRPHGGRQSYSPGRTRWKTFQLTPSRRATANLDKFFF